MAARDVRRKVTFPAARGLLRVLASLAITALAALPGCGPGAEDAGRPPPLRVLLPPGERPFWEPLARTFEHANPGIRVLLVEGPQPTDLRENLYTASLLARDPTFDLVYLDVTWTPKFAAAGWLLPLDDRLGTFGRARFLPEALDAGVYRDQLYRIPVRTDMGLLFYRRDWLDSAGIAPPTTFDELLRAARAFHDPPARFGYVWQGRQYEGLVCNYLEVLHGFGGAWTDARTGEVALDHAPAIAALRFLRSTLGAAGVSPRGVTTYQEEESRRLFADGRAAFLRNWTYVWRLLQREDSRVRGRVGVTLLPRDSAGRPAGTLGGWGLGISRYSRSPDLAFAFILHATTIESQRALCEPTGYAPSILAAYEDSTLLAANPFLAHFRTLHAGAVARPALPRYALASDVLQRHLSAALAGLADPADALRDAARETRMLLGDGSVGSAAGTGTRTR
ncbi:MAG: ABC transporter substrate-binding protein [Candidatus Eiseniibacteriota bacterium]